MIAATNNPFANKDGSPKKGFEFEFLDWSIEKDKQRISKLSTQEQKKEKAVSNRLKDKMES